MPEKTETTDLITKKPWFETIGRGARPNWGFKPVCWEGWTVILVAVAVIAGSYHLFGENVGLVVFLGTIFVVSLIALFTIDWFESR